MMENANIDGIVQYCSIPIANTLEILQSCTIDICLSSESNSANRGLTQCGLGMHMTIQIWVNIGSSSDNNLLPNSTKQFHIEFPRCYFVEWVWKLPFNTLRLRQNGRHFADNIFKSISLNENFQIWNKISLKHAPLGLIENMAALVQIMAWRQTGDKPLSEAMMVEGQLKG